MINKWFVALTDKHYDFDMNNIYLPDQYINKYNQSYEINSHINAI